MCVCVFFFFFIIHQLPTRVITHPGWRLMRLGYCTYFHTLYDEKKKKKKKIYTHTYTYIYIYILYKQDLAENNHQRLICY